MQALANDQALKLKENEQYIKDLEERENLLSNSVHILCFLDIVTSKEFGLTSFTMILKGRRAYWGDHSSRRGDCKVERSM